MGFIIVDRYSQTAEVLRRDIDYMKKLAKTIDIEITDEQILKILEENVYLYVEGIMEGDIEDGEFDDSFLSELVNSITIEELKKKKT